MASDLINGKHVCRGFFVLALLLSGPWVPAQDGRVRKLTEEGLTFTLPDGWEWQGSFASNVAIKAETQVRERTFEITAQLYFFSGQFLGEKVDTLVSESRKKDSAKTAWKFRYKQRFQNNSDVVFIGYTQVRGSGDTERRTKVRVWMFRRYGHLFEWREEVPAEAESSANGAFLKARKGLKFGKPANPIITDKKRDFVNQRVVYKLPKDWNWIKGKKGSKVKIPLEGKKTPDGKTSFRELFTIRTDALVKDSRVAIFCSLSALKTAGRPAQQAENFGKGVGEYWKDIKGYEIFEKSTIAGRKAVQVQFSAFHKDDDRRTTRIFNRQYYFKYKGCLMVWSEQATSAKPKAFERRLKTARKGLKPY